MRKLLIALIGPKPAKKRITIYPRNGYTIQATERPSFNAWIDYIYKASRNA